VSEGIILSPIKKLDELEVLERYTSLDRDSGSCAEVAKTVADPTFLGSVESDDDRNSWGLSKGSKRNHTPNAPPIWTPSSTQLPALPTKIRVNTLHDSIRTTGQFSSVVCGVVNWPYEGRRLHGALSNPLLPRDGVSVQELLSFLLAGIRHL
jgi:hypothetical protein